LRTFLASRRLYWIIAGGIVIGVWLAGSGVWNIGQRAGQPDPLPAMGARTAIVLLSAGTDPAGSGSALVPTSSAMYRIEKTVDVYDACKHGQHSCTVIVSGGDPDRQGAADAEIYRPVLLSRGVAPRDLVLESYSRNTYENAKFTSPLLKEGQFDSVVLVTSAYHMRRAQLNFDRFGIHTIAAPAHADSARPSLVPLRRNFAVAFHALHELAGIAQFWVYRWIGIF
jgi:uncharacterized SAM-binding protein YcdF (DUF218 family)